MIAQERRTAGSKAKAAAALKMSVTTFEKWLHRGMPRIADGGYDLDDCADFIATWKRENGQRNTGGSEGGDLREEKLQAEIRKLNADADAKELKNQISRGELMHRDDAIRDVSAAFLRIKTRLEAMPTEMEMGFQAGEERRKHKAEIERHIRLVLREMEAWAFEADADAPPEVDGDE